jgi:dolichol-phosphate mannosyltransferase
MINPEPAQSPVSSSRSAASASVPGAPGSILANAKLSIVVPVFDEADNVAPLVQRVLAAVGNWPGGVELILVDDCSRDSTWQNIREQSGGDERIVGVRHAKNRGQSAALWTGFRHASGNIIGTLDGDLQNDPADFPMMLQELAQCDLVCGVRTRRADTWVKLVSSRIARWARRVALQSTFLDTGCNLRVFRREVLSTIPPFDGLHRFMPILAQNGGAVVREVPVRHHPRTAGVSKYGVWNRLGRGIRDLIMIGLYVRRQLKTLGPELTSERNPESL